MRLIIDIPEDVYTRLFDNGIQDNEIATDDICEMARALRLGKPLPKGHGRLIDADELKKIIQENDVLNMTGFNVRLCDINNTPTIIEADKERGVVFKTICNSCVVCHKETIDPNPFYICDTCKEKLKADKEESEG